MRLSEKLQVVVAEGRYPKLEKETEQRLNRMLDKLLDAEDALRAAKKEKWQQEQQIGMLTARIEQYKASISKLQVAQKKLAKASG